MLGGCTGGSAGTAGTFVEDSGSFWNLLRTVNIPPERTFDADLDGSPVVVIG